MASIGPRTAQSPDQVTRAIQTAALLAPSKETPPLPPPAEREPPRSHEQDGADRNQRPGALQGFHGGGLPRVAQGTAKRDVKLRLLPLSLFSSRFSAPSRIRFHSFLIHPRFQVPIDARFNYQYDEQWRAILSPSAIPLGGAQSTPSLTPLPPTSPDTPAAALYRRMMRTRSSAAL